MVLLANRNVCDCKNKISCYLGLNETLDGKSFSLFGQVLVADEKVPSFVRFRDCPCNKPPLDEARLTGGAKGVPSSGTTGWSSVES